jgi:hypothetical protein
MSGYVQHDESSEGRQQVDPNEDWWQDSVFVAWHAHSSGIGGVFRIGHEPNFEGGRATLWFGIVTTDGTRYRRVASPSLSSSDLLEGGFGAGDGHYQQYYDGCMRYRADDEDLHLELEVQDFYPRTDFFPPGAGTVSEDFASAHYECSGRILGSVRLGGIDYEVDGLCHRDHSWGVRHWDTLLNHRWMPGTFGPNLSFGSIGWNGVDGSLRQFGYVVRGGEIIVADEVDIAVTMELDGLSYRHGSCTWTLPDGDRLVIDASPYDATLSENHNVAVIDGICELEQDGQIGFCDLEASTNPRAGTRPIASLVRANSATGLTHR